MKTINLDLAGVEFGPAHGCVMGQRDWREIVCRLVPGLYGCKVGMVGHTHVACDSSMPPTAAKWYYNRASFDEHMGRLP